MGEIKKNEELREDQLEQISGGELPITWALDGAGETLKVLRRDSRGNPIYLQSYRDGTPVGMPFYFVCPHCGRVLHYGALSRLYCDPCDEGWFQMNLPGECKRYGHFPD